MQKILLLSILVASALIPLRFASSRDPYLGLRRTLAGALGFEVLYLIALLFLFPRL